MKAVTTLTAAALLTACSKPTAQPPIRPTGEAPPMAESIGQFGGTFWPELQRIHDRETGVTCYAVRQPGTGISLSCVNAEVRQ